MMDAVNYQWSPFSSTGKIYRVVQKKGTVFLSTSQSWPAVAGCSKAETFSQLSSISFAQPCMCFCRDGARYEVHIHQLVTWLRVTKCKVYGLYFIDTTAKEIQQDTLFRVSESTYSMTRVGQKFWLYLMNHPVVPGGVKSCRGASRAGLDLEWSSLLPSAIRRGFTAITVLIGYCD